MSLPINPDTARRVLEFELKFYGPFEERQVPQPRDLCLVRAGGRIFEAVVMQVFPEKGTYDAVAIYQPEAGQIYPEAGQMVYHLRDIPLNRFKPILL